MVCHRRAVACTLAGLLAAVLNGVPLQADQPTARIPIIYSSDLHHPHVDPDDHYDLATLFSLAEFDIRAIVLDCGARQKTAPGAIPLKQLMNLSGRDVPWAVGLPQPLGSADDDGRSEEEAAQAGVQLILDQLRASPTPVTLFTTGSLRDVAAAYNRDPELMASKVERLYVNIGNPATGKADAPTEYNVSLDPWAYYRVMNSDLPVYWCPCFDGPNWQRGRNGTFWRFTQGAVLQHVSQPLQNWFLFALTKPPHVAPVAWLDASYDDAARQRVWGQPRNMWCTAPFLHAANRSIYQSRDGDYLALQPAHAAARDLDEPPSPVFCFQAARWTAERREDGVVKVTMREAAADSRTFVFRSDTDRYGVAMTRCLRQLLSESFPR
jgi:hypothetical protein